MKLQDIKGEMAKQGPAIVAGLLFVAAQEAIRAIAGKLLSRKRAKEKRGEALQ
jgi:hypothetical protein